MGLVYTDLEQGIGLPPEEVSKKMDEFGWTDGWRIHDVDKEIFDGGCSEGDCLFNDTCVFFVVDTATMTIAKYNPIGYEGIIEAIKKIDEEN